MKPRLPKPALRVSPTLVVAVFALVVAMSGSATAALMVNGKNIQKNAIATKHIKKNAVAAKHIKKNAVKQKHLAPAIKKQLAAAGTAGPAGPAGPAGADGATGPTGAKGATGAVGISGYQTVSTSVAVKGYADGPTLGYGKALAVCPSGKKALGGGAHWQYGTATNVVVEKNNSITNSAPRFAAYVVNTWSDVSPSASAVANSWVATGYNGDDNDERQLVAWVICANVS